MPFTRVSRTVHLHNALVKLSNFCVERSQTLFRWAFDLQTTHTSTQLTIRYGRPSRIVFTIHISTAPKKYPHKEFC